MKRILPNGSTEWECDGGCGTKVRDPQLDPTWNIPIGWFSKTVRTDRGRVRFHLCPDSVLSLNDLEGRKSCLGVIEYAVGELPYRRANGRIRSARRRLRMDMKRFDMDGAPRKQEAA